MTTEFKTDLFRMRMRPSVRQTDGRPALVYAEDIWDIEPYNRCSEIMDQFGITCCGPSRCRTTIVRWRSRIGILAGFSLLAMGSCATRC
jgi:hypothetical protein